MVNLGHQSLPSTDLGRLDEEKAFPGLKHLRFGIIKLQETKLPVRLINTTNERRLVQGHKTIPLRVKGDIEDVCSELDDGG
ncbi:hypothetical protein TNCV_515781 [Trichonephila clavipes]|nr:hypothetical protein TNCV_515781 [Trichonephila clavipes]